MEEDQENDLTVQRPQIENSCKESLHVSLELLPFVIHRTFSSLPLFIQPFRS